MKNAKKAAGKAAAISADEGSVANIEAAVQNYGFCGKLAKIKLFKGEPHEPAQPFVGINGYQIQIQRDKWVTVPVEVADHLESLTYKVREPDPDFPDEFPEKHIWVENPRFPMQRQDLD